ncbi:MULTISPECIES: TrfB-related DNA-binding protein [Pseudoalteromonas]|uniref:TrfB-related DNA-binding protein n=1 Tax=Pseudoalteromonas TaxID=53246 RepID=UPI001EF5E0BA|nr:TrfB-related DNA-binding protein [Pseudoalteromonas sp. Of11M-6]MCG7556054.1 transcriptional regulator KorA [Pseudoalteromonas sp. Of11M-6]
MSKLKISEADFLNYRSKSSLSEKTLDIAYSGLVLGVANKDIAEKFEVTKGAVTQAIARVKKDMGLTLIPSGFERVTAILPEHQAYQVRLWEEKASNKIKEIQSENNSSSTTKGRSR